MKSRIPSNWISWSQISLFECSKKDYIKQYIYGEKWNGNKYTELGKKFAEAVEKNKSNDPIISFLISSLPKYPQREYEMKTPITINKKHITLFSKVDGIDVQNKSLGEYKTGKLWTQERADKHEQLLFYHLVYYLMYNTMLDNIHLYWVETKEENNEIGLTGKFDIFEVKHTKIDLLNYKLKVKKLIKGIMELYAQELNKI